jgi:hypothetical protein
MKGGRVVRLRLSPQDCMSVVDVAERIGMAPRGASFAQLVSMALSSLLEGVRAAEIVPRRDGFEYLEMMEPFKDQPLQDRARKLAITKSMKLQKVTAVPLEEDPAKKSRRLRYEELKIKLDNAPESFSPEDRAELRPLVEEFFE